LIANRAVERVIDEQELHHPFPRLLHHRRHGDDFLIVRDWKRAGSLRLGRPRLHLDKAHAAIAGDRQPLVIAETRDFLARKLARLKHRRARGTSISTPSTLTLGISSGPGSVARRAGAW
jgi:hypothetical protein